MLFTSQLFDCSLEFSARKGWNLKAFQRFSFVSHAAQSADHSFWPRVGSLSDRYDTDNNGITLLTATTSSPAPLTLEFFTPARRLRALPFIPWHAIF